VSRSPILPVSDAEPPAGTTITIDAVLTFDEFCRRVRLLLDDLAATGVEHVVCPSIEALLLRNGVELVLADPEPAEGYLSDARTYALPADSEVRRPAYTERRAASGAAHPAIIAVTDGFRYSKAVDVEVARARYDALVARWGLSGDERILLARQPWRLKGLGSVTGPGWEHVRELSTGDRLDLYERIATDAAVLMDGDAAVAAWLRGPHGMSCSRQATPLGTLLYDDWRRIRIMAEALRWHRLRRAAEGDTEPSLLDAGFDWVLQSAVPPVLDEMGGV
jgi:hypothetical protein